MKIVSIIGARPQFIKAASVSRAINEFNKRPGKKNHRIKEIVIHSGQHYDYNMSDVFFRQLELSKPDYNLGVGSHSHGKQTALMLEKIEAILIKEKPGLVMVYGDTNSTLSGALAAKKLSMPLAHIEAGLRSYDMAMPEEINRVCVDHISDILFCPSRNAVNSLRLEGIKNSPIAKFPKVFQVGDVMYDSVCFYLNIAKKYSRILKELSLAPKAYYLATVHRAKNTNEPMYLKAILRCLSEAAQSRLPVVFPIHPRTKNAIHRFRLNSLTVPLTIIDPLSYLDMLMLEYNAKAIFTDSGGVQKEAYFLRVPCITLRDQTEWIETVNCNFNILVGVDKNKINRALDKVTRLDKKPPQVYGNGKASEKIIRILNTLLR